MNADNVRDLHTVRIVREACAEVGKDHPALDVLDTMSSQLRRDDDLSLTQLATLHTLNAELVEAER